MSEATDRYHAIVGRVCNQYEQPVSWIVRNQILTAANNEYFRNITYSSGDMKWLSVIWERMHDKAFHITLQYNDCRLKGADIERKYLRSANGHSDCMMGELIPLAKSSPDRDAFWNDVATLSKVIHQELLKACE